MTSREGHTLQGMQHWIMSVSKQEEWNYKVKNNMESLIAKLIYFKSL